ncbi:hypothetical protein QR680_008911 [Steinernema hermaphroditum]|uniref:ubiquitinyl hydrolase 1 n=1 Tax=Steinernema hermaphroditum TaxID=289476 RepID=A0AA39M8Y0_9BILA|nr:hypothetical protein QR680_008911 [Steinernema hermaphroditum]
MTIGDDVAKQQNLGYNSLEELKRSAGFNADARKSLLSRNLTVEKLMKSVENLRRQARSERENNGLETAYTYLFRIGEICDIITRDHPVFSKTRFEGSPDARRLHRIFAQSFAELEKIQTEISELYKKKASARVLVADIVEVSAHPTNGKTKEQKEQSSSVISPRDLVRLVETESKLALIVDFREDRSEIVKFKKESQIAVAEIPKSCLENAYTFQLVVTALPVGSSSRMLLNKLSMFDLIVLLDSGSDADPVDVNGKIIRNSPSGILSAALYDYNNLHLPKAPPLYLKGGFANWRMSYPVYVASADGSVRKASQFGAGESDIERAIQNLRKFRRVTVDYPDLYYKPPPPREPSPVEPLEEYSPVHPVELPETSVPTNEDRMELRASPVPIQPTPTISSSLNDSVARQIPQRPDQPIPRQMPIVDRSVKPKPLEHEYSSHPAPVDRNGKDAAPQGVARSDVSTFPSISSSSIAPSARSALVVPPQRPTVDRTTKEAVERKEAEFRREILSMYDACVENLRMKSRRGHVKPGHTGLVNIVNTCFMNTTLQALANTVPLRTLFCKKNFTRIINRHA